MENQPRSEPPPVQLSDALATVLSSMLTLVAIACLLEPEEVLKYVTGEMDFAELSVLMMARIPNGGENSAVRFVRALGIRLDPELVNRCYESLEMDGVPVDSWLTGLTTRVTALEDTLSQPARERDEE